MALYSYQAFSKDGKKVNGFIDASSVASVKEQLTKQELFPVKIELAQQGARQSWFTRLFSRGVSLKEKILFTKQLAVLLRSGVPLLQALELLVDQVTGRLRSITISVKDEIKEGESLATALAQYPNVFDTIYVQLVRAGEASGNLEVILERLATFLERRETIQKKVRSALQYPMIQMVVATIVVIGLLVWVVPGITANLTAEGKELPWPTQFVMGMGDFITHYYLILIFVLIIIVVIFQYWKRTPNGARILDKIKLKLPLVKYIAQTNAVVQFSYTLGLLLEGGVNLAEALDIVVKIINNRILADTLREARDKIIKQGKIAQYLKQTDIFPPIAIYLIKTGEETGQLDKMLLLVAKNYEEDLSELIDRLTGLISPLMLVVVGIIVGFILLSVMLPILQMTEIAGA